MTNAPKIRNAALADAQDLVRVIDAAYQPYRARLEDLPPVSEGVDEDIRQHKVWVAELENAIVGGIFVTVVENRAILTNLAVDPGHAGRGIGRKLIDIAERFCREHSMGELHLSTHVKMPENIALYTHLGWVETGRTGNKVHMSKRL
ncbi:MAG: GNAT family N-acetyltransferase [Rhizobiaceae bacterium]